MHKQPQSRRWRVTRAWALHPVRRHS
jgi:hypothetical protein